MTPSGNYLCGGVELSSSTLDIVSNSRPTQSMYESSSSFTDGTDLYVLNQESAGAALPALRFRLESAFFFGAPALERNFRKFVDAGRRILANRRVPRQSACCSRPTPEAALPRSPRRRRSPAAYSQTTLDAASIESTTISGLSEQSGWLTRDGLVTLSYDQNSRISRYAFSSGAEIDSERLPSSSGDRKFAFDASGSYRLYFDKGAGTLHLMRTWWK